MQNQSRLTFLPDSIYNYACIENCLEGEYPESNGDVLKSVNFDQLYKDDEVLNSFTQDDEVCDMEKYIEKQGLPNAESFQKQQSWISKLKDWFYRLIFRRLFPRGIFYHPGQIRILDRCSISRAPFLFLPPRQSIGKKLMP